MNRQEMPLKLKINEAAKLTGVTVRTLHYYDEIGLLKPSGVSETGYREYDMRDLEILQQIMFYRELDFPLSEIKELLKTPGYDKQQALKNQKELLLKKREHLDGLISLVNKTLKGEAHMSFKEFDMSEIETFKRVYAKEVKTRWGHTDAYAQSAERTKEYGVKEWNAINSESSDILRQFGESRALSPDSQEARLLVERWRSHISAHFYECTSEILAGLGDMYVSDERFRENIDKYGTGTAEFMANAIAVYCRDNE